MESTVLGSVELAHYPDFSGNIYLNLGEEFVVTNKVRLLDLLEQDSEKNTILVACISNEKTLEVDRKNLEMMAILMKMREIEDNLDHNNLSYKVASKNLDSILALVA